MDSKATLSSVSTVGIVGAGGMARVHADAWRRIGVKVAVFSRSGGSDLLLDGETEAQSLLELVSDVDLLDVCSPTPTHLEAAAAGIDAGIPVVCEKPLALTVADADRLVALAKSAGVPLFPAHVVRYFPAYVAARDALLSGALGEPAVARFVRMGEFPHWSDWFDDDSQSGGIMMDQMIHDLDMAAWLLGPVLSVHAVSHHATSAPARTAHVTLTHQSGAISTATGVWGAPGLTFATRFHVAGSEGRLDHDSRDTPSVTFDGGRRGVESRRPAEAVGDPYENQLRDVLTVLRDGGTPRTTPTEGAYAVRIARAAIESSVSGATVTLEGSGSC
ncbi:MAG: Gfo/Idh/MocA family oxidoreductase [Arachnia sp.]